MSYQRSQYPRRMPKSQRSGGGGGWMVVIILVIAIIALWWIKTQREPIDPSIISSPTPGNNSPTASPGPELTPSPSPDVAASAQNQSLTYQGFSLWGVQLGAYSTLQAAQQALGVNQKIVYSGDRYRVLDSLWPSRQQADARQGNVSQESYVTPIEVLGLSLKLTGKQEEIDMMAAALDAWESALSQLMELLPMAQDLSAVTLADCLGGVSHRLGEVIAMLQGGQGPLAVLRESLDETLGLVDGTLAVSDQLSAFVASYVYNVLGCYAVYAQYGAGLAPAG